MRNTYDKVIRRLQNCVTVGWCFHEYCVCITTSVIDCFFQIVHTVRTAVPRMLYIVM